MRITAVSLLALVVVSGCASEEASEPAAFRLQIDAPERGTMRADLAPVPVRGRLVSLDGSPIAGAAVDINGTTVPVAFDGTFAGEVPVVAGTNLIHTAATDANGNHTEDTRAVLAGASTAVDSPLADSINVAISDDAFARIATAAGGLLATMDMGALTAPMNPVVNAGAPNGEDCLFAIVTLLDVGFSDPTITLVPRQGAMAFTAELRDLDVPLNARYAAACLDGSTDIRVTADRVFVSGTLSMNIINGQLAVALDQPEVQIDGFYLAASGVPNKVLNLFDMNETIASVITWGFERFMPGMLRDAMADFQGVHQTLPVMGHELDMSLAPTSIALSPSGAILRMDTRMSVVGSEATDGFVFTPNGTPSVTAGNGFQLAIADDLANQLLAGFWAVGGLDLTVPHQAGPFDTLTVEARLPPRVTGTAGNLEIVVGDMLATLSADGVAQATLAVNLELDLVVDGTGNVIALRIGDAPVIHADVVEDEVTNVTGFNNDDLDALLELSIRHMVDTIGTVVGEIPIPSVAGVTVNDLDIGGRDGFVTVTGSLR